MNKDKITGWIYDYADVDGDRVAVYRNGKLIPGFENLTLAKQGAKFRVKIKPGINTLRLQNLSVGGPHPDGSKPPCTIGVKLDKTNMSAGDEVQTAGGFLGDTPSISFGFSYITIPSWRAPESAAHLEEAQAAGYPKLVTIGKNPGALYGGRAGASRPSWGGGSRSHLPNPTRWLRAGV